MSTDAAGNRTVEAHDEAFAEAESRIDAARRDGARELSLADLGLTELPAALAGLAALESLSLRGNKLTALPAWLADLSMLTVLDLSNNQIVELPAALGTLSALVELDVSGNRHLILPPPDVVALGTRAILDFLRSFDGEGEPWAWPQGTPRSSEPDLAGEDPSEDVSRADRSIGMPPAALRVGAVVTAAVALVGAAAVADIGNTGGKAGSSAAAAAAAAAATRRSDAPGSASPAPDLATSGAATSAGVPAQPTPSSTPAASPAGTPTTVRTPTSAVTSAFSSAVASASQPSAPRVVAPASTTVRTPPSANPSAVQYPVAPPTVDLAVGRPVSATSVVQNYVPTNAVDGDSGTYWEGVGGSSAFPQTFTVDLGTVTTVGRLELDLPPVADWGQRTETITVLGAAAADGSYTTVVASRGYAFDARTGDTTGVSFNPVHIRYLRLVFTANSGWTAAQLSELKIFS